MKSLAFLASRPIRLAMAVAAVLGFADAIAGLSMVHAATDPNLNVTIKRTNQNVVLSWFGSNAVAYRVESSLTLTAWTNSSSVITGGNAFLFVTNSIVGQNRGFFRVKRLIPEATSAVFDPQTGVLTIIGDDQDNVIVVSRDAAGRIRVNNGAVSITGGASTVANTTLIQIFGRAGNDQLSLDESNGALPAAHLFGEAGADTLIGGSGADIIDGGAGPDILFGRGGMDSLFGGDDNDVITGGDGNDTAQMGAGNDRFVWNPGDDTDVVEGGGDIDTVEVNGGNGAEDFTVTPNATRVRFDRVTPAPFSLNIGTCENLVVNANGGDDMFFATGNLAALIQITVDGGPGNDTIIGSNGSDFIAGGDGDDFVDGQQGDDMIFLGADNDTFHWDSGDGSDIVEGQAGNDTLEFNGNDDNETIELSANAGRLRCSRNIGNIVLDVGGVETVQFNAAGGADVIRVNDLSTTEVNLLNLRLAGVPGGNTGDSQIDTVILNGTAGIDNITAAQVGTDLSIVGLKPLITIFSGETNDVITINGQGGNDTIDASGITSLFALTIDGGPGNDTIIGSSRADVLIGGDDQDTIAGRQGNDRISGGPGDDTFIWNPGDANDVLEGQAGTDRLLFFGSDVSEILDASANGPRLRFSSDVGNVVLDCDDVEKVQLHLLGGTDSLTINELTSTDVSDVIVDLAVVDGGGDAQPDSIIINGTQTNDNVVITGSPGTIAVTGLSASVTITNAEPADDSLTLNALGGQDTVDASGLAAGVIKFSMNGGPGEDVLIGSQGADLITGGDGNDRILGGPGDDTLVWNPGDDNDIFEGQAGNDTLQFNGANISEAIDLSANGGRLRFSRNVATVILDCDDVEIVRFEAVGGADLITVNDLSGTDVTAININLGSTLGGSTGDGQPDSIIINGTGADDVVTVSGAAGQVSVLGLSAAITLTGSEAANDRVTIKTLAGDDVVEASGLPGGIIALTADGGADDDILIGSAGADILLGGEGDDVLLGGPGLDVLDGGPGNNVIIQD